MFFCRGGGTWEGEGHKPGTSQSSKATQTFEKGREQEGIDVQLPFSSINVSWFLEILESLNFVLYILLQEKKFSLISILIFESGRNSVKRYKNKISHP